MLGLVVTEGVCTGVVASTALNRAVDRSMEGPAVSKVIAIAGFSRARRFLTALFRDTALFVPPYSGITATF